MNSIRNSSSGSDRAVATCRNFRRPCVAPLVSRCLPCSLAKSLQTRNRSAALVGRSGVMSRQAAHGTLGTPPQLHVVVKKQPQSRNCKKIRRSNLLGYA
jgi:hypothetical protein